MHGAGGVMIIDGVFLLKTQTECMFFSSLFTRFDLRKADLHASFSANAPAQIYGTQSTCTHRCEIVLS